MNAAAGAALFLILFLAAHTAKFIRLYLVLMEEKRLPILQTLGLYARTTFVNLLIPFKLGEFYRIFEVFLFTGSGKVGVSCVAVDRFFDTAALLAIILPFELLFVGRLSLFPLLLFVGLIILLFLYLSFQPSYRYLNRYFICRKRSQRALGALKALDLANDWFQYVRRLVSGRSPLILLSSFFGWGMEFLALKVFAGLFGEIFGIYEFNQYINSIFLSGDSMVEKPYSLVALVIVGAAALFFTLLWVVRRLSKFPKVKQEQ
ncbi:MAG: flippase-like domain-containing protein [Lachnospiraceae bacterium]|nr:flippase-like domain-containing protein [Lachnospiraceae bacterium]